MFINIILKFLLVTVGNRNVFLAKDNPSFINDFYFLLLYNI